MPSSIIFLTFFMHYLRIFFQISKINKFVYDLQQVQRNISELSKKLEQLREEEQNILQTLQREMNKTGFGQTHLQILKLLKKSMTIDNNAISYYILEEKVSLYRGRLGHVTVPEFKMKNIKFLVV